MSEKRSFIRWIAGYLAPFVLIILGAILIGVGWEQDWKTLLYAGLAVLGAGVLWGLVLVLFHGPLDWFD